MALFLNTRSDSKEILQSLIEGVNKYLSEVEEEKTAKSIRWFRKRHSVSFSFPKELNLRVDVEFKKGSPGVFVNPASVGSYMDYLIVYVPFSVEKVGENMYIARD